jgi:hypothetical protein
MSQNEESKVSTSQGVLAEVADALKTSPSLVRSRLVSALTERELVKRVDTLDKALTKRAQLQGEVNKIRLPSKKAFKLVNGQMQEVEAVFTQEEVKKFNEETKQYAKQLKEATEKLQKFDNALEKAFAGEGFDKLTNLVGGKDVSDDENKSE